MSMAEERPSRVVRGERNRITVVGGEHRRSTARMPVPAVHWRSANESATASAMASAEAEAPAGHGRQTIPRQAAVPIAADCAAACIRADNPARADTAQEATSAEAGRAAKPSPVVTISTTAICSARAVAALTASETLARAGRAVPSTSATAVRAWSPPLAVLTTAPRETAARAGRTSDDRPADPTATVVAMGCQAALCPTHAPARPLHGPFTAYSRARTPEASKRTLNVPPVTPRSAPKSSRQTRGLVRPATVLAT